VDATERTETIHEARRAPHADLSPEPHLFVLYGGAAHPGGARHSLRGLDEVRVGRAAGAMHFVRAHDGATAIGTLELPCSALSSSHLRLRRGRGGWTVEDLGSKNGTWLDGARVDARLLRDGDVIEAGRVALRFRAALPTATTTPADTSADTMVGRPDGLRTLLPALDASYAALLRVARAPVPALLLGPTGAGKEVAARAIHDASGRAGPFVALNCGAIPAGLREATLFGHVRGAFSGATRDELGVLRSAEGGTLLLDEIGDLPRAAQVAFLRALQEGEVTPVGASRPVRVDVRIVAATHRPLDELVRAGEFREDLYARLTGFVCALPPLRERIEDLGLLLPALLAHLSATHGRALSLDRGVVPALVARAWPRNFREVVQLLSGAAAVADGSAIGLAHFPSAALGDRIAESAVDVGGPSTNFPVVPYEDDDSLRALLQSLLTRHAGNVAAVARAIGRKPAQIHRWMKRVGLTPSVYRQV
jgi:transcriptional regulator with GAF, ATPase, and Fis domain